MVKPGNIHTTQRTAKRRNKKMKASDLIVGKKYWCVWAHSYGWFVKLATRRYCGKTETVAVFSDVSDVLIECSVKSIEHCVRDK